MGEILCGYLPSQGLPSALPANPPTPPFPHSENRMRGWWGLGDLRVACWVGLGVEDTHTKFHPFLTRFGFLGNILVYSQIYQGYPVFKG